MNNDQSNNSAVANTAIPTLSNDNAMSILNDLFEADYQQRLAYSEVCKTSFELKMAKTAIEERIEWVERPVLREDGKENLFIMTTETRGLMSKLSSMVKRMEHYEYTSEIYGKMWCAQLGKFTLVFAKTHGVDSDEIQSHVTFLNVWIDIEDIIELQENLENYEGLMLQRHNDKKRKFEQISVRKASDWDGVVDALNKAKGSLADAI